MTYEDGQAAWSRARSRAAERVSARGLGRLTDTEYEAHRNCTSTCTTCDGRGLVAPGTGADGTEICGTCFMSGVIRTPQLDTCSVCARKARQY